MTRSGDDDDDDNNDTAADDEDDDIASVQLLSSLCILSSHFESTVFPILDLCNPSHFPTSSFFWLLIILLWR